LLWKASDAVLKRKITRYGSRLGGRDDGGKSLK
jgi:hypothetical protein